MNWVKHIIVAVVVLLIQLLVCEFVNIWPPIYISIAPLFIILLPLSIGRLSLMFIAFGLGLLIDILSDGIAGLNAAALTAVAYSKDIYISYLTKYESQSLQIDYNITGDKFSKFVLLLILAFATFFFFYIILDGLGSSNMLFLLIRFIINVVINVLIAYLLEKLWIRKLFS